MNLFIPSTAYINPKSLKYETGKECKKYLEKINVPIINSKNVIIDSSLPGKNYAKAKKTVLQQACRKNLDHANLRLIFNLPSQVHAQPIVNIAIFRPPKEKNPL